MLITAVGLFIAICSLEAQTPQSICYQGVATDAIGMELQGRTINVRTTILSDAPSGTPEWTEFHQVQTDDFGLFNLNIGEGIPAGGAATAFSEIKWGEHAFFLRVEMDETGGADYQLMGVSQMMSVPYALHSKGAEIAQTAVVADSASIAQFAYSALNDEDTSPTNELQNAEDVNITTGTFDGQTVSDVLEAIYSEIGGVDGDTDATNELQEANEVNVTGGNYNGQTVEEALGNVNSEVTTISTQVTQVINQVAADADGDATNEIQELTYDGATLGITGGNTIALGDVAFSAPGASIIYPQGILGNYIVVTSPVYQVPAGKNFYVTGGPPIVNLNVNGTSYTHTTTPNMPVLGAGQVIQDCNCLGLLVDENEIIDVEIVDFQNSSTYTVPDGEVFVVKSGMVNDAVSYLVVNGVQIEFFRPSFLRSSNLLSFPSGTTLQMPNNVSEMVLTGYLIELE